MSLLCIALCSDEPYMAPDILISTGSGNGLPTIMHQAITWINMTYWHLASYEQIKNLHQNLNIAFQKKLCKIVV